MTRLGPQHPHNPENAEHELKKAFNCVIETGVTHFWDRSAIPEINPAEVAETYMRAFTAYQNNNRLLAERWARTAKHLARALWHEAKIAYFTPRTHEPPALGQATLEYNLRESTETTADLIDSVSERLSIHYSKPSQNSLRYLARGRKHLKWIESNPSQHELLIAEHIKAAHEYGRVLECLCLAYEAEHEIKTAA